MVILRLYINEVYSIMIMMSTFGILKETNKIYAKSEE